MSGDGNIVVGNVGGDLSIKIGDAAEEVLPILAPYMLPDSESGEVLSPALRVHPWFCPIDLVGRDEEKEDLLRWATETDQRIMFRAVGGQGGAGKTRLGLELCRQLDGWLAGFLHREDLKQAELARLCKLEAPCLLVVDYAETRLVQVEKLASASLAPSTNSVSRLRVLLLTRHGDRLPSADSVALGRTKARRATMNVLESAQSEVFLDAQPLSVELRERLFREALASFSDLGVASSFSDVPDLTNDDVYGAPVMVLIAAVLAQIDPDVRSRVLASPADFDRQRLLDTLLSHEQQYWDELKGGDLELSCRVLSATTLSPTVDERQTAAMLAQLVPDLAESSMERLRAVARWAREQYPPDRSSGRWVSPVEPDLIGEHLIVGSLVGEPESFVAALRQPDGPATHTLRVLKRAFASRRVLRPVLSGVVAETLQELCHRAVAQVEFAAGPDDAEAELMASALVDLLPECELEAGHLQRVLRSLPDSHNPVLVALYAALDDRRIAAYRLERSRLTSAEEVANDSLASTGDEQQPTSFTPEKSVWADGGGK